MADVQGGSDARVQGQTAHDSPLSDKPIAVGARASASIPAAVADGDASHALLDLYGRIAVSLDPDTGQALRVGGFGGLEVGDRNLVMADYLGDSIDTTRWTVTNANGGTATSSVGEGLFQTSANANGSTFIQSIEKLRWVPGVSYSFGCELRLSTALAANTVRWGLFTGGLSPVDGYYFEATGVTPTFNIVSIKNSVATTVASGSFSRNGTNPFVIDNNYHRYEILISGNLVFFAIDGIVRHVLTHNTITTARVTSMYLPMCISNANVSAAATNRSVMATSIWVAKFGDVSDDELPHVVQNKVAQYTTTQTGTALWTPATGKFVNVTSIQIQAGGTTAGAVQVWFGQSADTTYTRGTDRAIFDGEFAPSATLKPGVVQNAPPHGWRGNVDDVLRVTDAAAINPLTINVWGYEA